MTDVAEVASYRNLRHLLEPAPQEAHIRKKALFLRPNGRSVLSVAEAHLKWRGFGGGYLRRFKSLISIDLNRVAEVAEVVWSNLPEATY